MAELEDIANNQNMVDIANAIRKATRSTEPMTIPEMPERMLDIRVIEKALVTADFSATGPLLLGTYNTTEHHFFLALPKSNNDLATLTKTELESNLVYDGETGELWLNYNRPVNEQADIYVLDMLIPNEEETEGVIIATEGEREILETYSELAYYRVGELFLYQEQLGVTLVAHGAEPFNRTHNILLANRFVQQEGSTFEFKDLIDVYNLLLDEEEERQNEVERLDGDVETLETDLQAESQRAESAEASLSGRLAAVESDYLTGADKAELSSSISQEATRAKAAEQAIQNDLSTFQDDMGEAIEGLQQDISDAVSGAFAKIDIGSGQEVIDGTVFPRITVEIAKQIYSAYTSGKAVILRWNVMGSIPVEATVLGSDYINSIYSFSTLIHNAFLAKYSYADESEGNASLSVISLSASIAQLSDLDNIFGGTR